MILRIVLIIILAFLAVTAVQKVIFAFYKRKLIGIIEHRFAGRRIILMALNANFFGKKSKGVGQIRGNGALVLTDDQLWFCLAAPTREIAIPINQIQSVETKRSHLGRTIFRPLLAVMFNYQGQNEQIAWYVSDPGKWKSAIESMIR
jgi:hypothetical protein